MNNRRGKLFIVSGPSGTGKGTIVRALLEFDKTIALSVSATTREPRPGERDGEHYYFVSETEFEEMIAKDGLLEYAKYLGVYYGTPLATIEDWLLRGIDVILEIEIQGGFQVKQKFEEAVLVFVVPPDMVELEKRLRNRGSETEDRIVARLARAHEELTALKSYDYVVVNDTVEQATSDIHTIIRAERLRVDKNMLNRVEPPDLSNIGKYIRLTMENHSLSED